MPTRGMNFQVTDKKENYLDLETPTQMNYLKQLEI